MTSGHLSARVRQTITAIVLLYSVVTFSGSFLDHDYACHQRSRTHCTFCQIIHLDQKVEVHKTYVQKPSQYLSGIELHADASGDRPALSLVSDRAPPA